MGHPVIFDPTVIEVNGSPAPQGSKSRGRHGGMFETSKKVGPWRNAVRTETQSVITVPFDGPVKVEVSFYLPRPKSHYGTGRNAGVLKTTALRYPTGVPDIDKLCRSTLDGLKEGGAYHDDAQVVHLVASKVYVEARATGATISISLI